MEYGDDWIRLFNHHSRLMEIRCWKDFFKSGCKWMYVDVMRISNFRSWISEIFRDPQEWYPFPVLFPYHSLKWESLKLAGERGVDWGQSWSTSCCYGPQGRGAHAVETTVGICLLSLIMDVVENHFHESWFHLLLLDTFRNFSISNPTKSFVFLRIFFHFWPN